LTDTLDTRLRQSAEETRNVAELAADCSYGLIVDPDGTIREQWTAGDYQRFTGYSSGELDPREWVKIVHPEDREKLRSLQAVAVDGETESVDIRILRKDGRPIWVNHSQRVWRDGETGALHVVGTVRDISERLAATEERHRLETYLRHMQKNEALGTLAGGVAHDFNNLLYIVIGNAELALRKLPAGATARANVEEILNVARRGAEITAKILAFSRPELADDRHCDLDEVTAEAIALLRATIPTSVAIDLDTRGPCTVRLGATDLHQILINLFTNASDAMPEGGRIRVEIEPIAIAEGDRRPGGIAPGSYARLVVADTGAGMSSAVAERIFEPRFTTKPPGRGSGMGLAVVQGIVQGYGGSIECESVPGKGTTFRVLLPALPPAGRDEAAAAQTGEGRGRILFIDDEPDVVRMAREMLESLGYEVEGRTSSRQALEEFLAAPSRFDLVLTDQTMPDLTGEALVREIRLVRPEMPVILCSGYHEQMGPETVSKLAVRACLQKPIDIDTLSRAVRGALEPASRDT
jgi:PAS domain S-box-containing protein